MLVLCTPVLTTRHNRDHEHSHDDHAHDDHEGDEGHDEHDEKAEGYVLVGVMCARV